MENNNDKFIRDTPFGRLMESKPINKDVCLKCKYGYAYNLSLNTKIETCFGEPSYYFAKDEDKQDEKQQTHIIKQNMENNHVNFGQAIEAAKQGKRISRSGWNGSGMFAYIVPAASYPAQTGAAKAHFGENGMVPYRAYWALKTAQEDVATWAPSGSDSLAEDWIILD